MLAPAEGPSGGQHQAGTCRMGNDPATSVTDAWGRVWGHDNLHIVDGSLHVTNGGVNPVLTILALAYRVSRRVAKSRDADEIAGCQARLRGQPFSDPQGDDDREAQQPDLFCGPPPDPHSDRDGNRAARSWARRNFRIDPRRVALSSPPLA